MTGNEIVSTALIWLGYTDSNGNPDSDAARSPHRHGLLAVREIYADLKTALGESDRPLLSLSTALDLPDRLLIEVMPYGVAMLLALAEGDSENEAIFSQLYRQKRRLVNRTETHLDVVPTMPL